MKDRELRKRTIYFIVILTLITLIDLVLILNADRERYTVIFIDGDMVSPFIVKENEKVNELENKKENFIGWYLNDAKYDFSEIVRDNLILKAKYEEITMYTVTFDTDGGTEIPNVMVKNNKTLIEPTSPTKENYRFKGWILNDEIYDFNLPVTQDLLLKAFWEEIPDEDKVYTITFDSDGGSTLNPLRVNFNESGIKPADPVKEGYVFRGWYKDGKLFSWSSKITSNLLLKAGWTAKTVLKLTFDSDGGTPVSPMEVYKGETAILPEVTKVGYVFAGWYYKNIKYTNETKINSSIKLKAKWISSDEANALAAVAAIKPTYEILKAGTKIKVTYAGCVITNTNASVLDEIRRELTDKTITLKFDVICGTVKKYPTSKAIIKASTYTYSVENLTLTINGTNFDGEIYKNDGTKIANVISGVATLTEEIEENIVLILRDDPNTKYVLSKK